MDSISGIHQICVQVFEAIAKTTSFFVVPLFMMRIVFSNILGEGSKVFAILKSTIVYFCLIAAFPLIIEIMFSIPDSYLPKFDSISSLTNDSPDWTSVSIIPFTVDRIFEVLLAGLYWVAYYLHIFFMIVMCSMAPIVFLSSTILGLGLGLEIFLGLLIVGSSWPIIWYGFDQVHAQLMTQQSDEFGSRCLEMLLTLFKGLSPVAFASVAIQSPPGRAITTTARASIATTRWAVGKTGLVPQGANSNFHNKSKSKSIERNRNSSPAWQKANGSPQEAKNNRLDRAKNQQPDLNLKGAIKNENPRPRNIET